MTYCLGIKLKEDLADIRISAGTCTTIKKRFLCSRIMGTVYYTG